MSTEEDVEIEAEEVLEGEDVIEEPVQVKYYQAETEGGGSGAGEAGKEEQQEEVARSSGVIEIPVMGASEGDVEIEAEEMGPEDRTDQQVTDIAEDQTAASGGGGNGRPKTSTQASLDDVVEIPVEYEESLTTEPPVTEPISEKQGAGGGGLIEIAVVQLSEAEEPPKPPGPETPEEYNRRISVHVASAPRGMVEIPVQVSASESSEPPAPEPEPATPEPSTPTKPEPPGSRKTSRKQPPSKTPSVEKTSEPTSPVKKVSAAAFKAGSKTPSVDRSEAEEKSTASSVASKKSSAAAPAAPTPAPAASYKEVAIEQEAPAPAPEPTPVVTKPEYRDVKIEQETAAPKPIPEEPAAVREIPVVPQAEPEAVKKPSTTAATFMEIPVSVEAEEGKPAAAEPTPRLIDVPVATEPSPPRRITPPRRPKEPIEPYIAAQLEQAPKVKLPPRTSSYVSYASWAPAEFNNPPFVPHSAFVARAPKFRNEHTATYKYVPPALDYLNEFDDYVKVGSFSKNLWAEDRAFRRSRSLDRRRPIGGYATSQFGPPPLRRAGSTSLPTSTAPSRSTSFTNLMDYVVATNNDLRRSRSRSRMEADVAEYNLSRTASRGHVVSSELLNYEPDPFERQAYTTYNYVRRLHEPYESTVDSYYGRYSGRPYGPYAGATHYDHLYPRDDYSTRKLRRFMADQFAPSSARHIYEDNPLFVSRNLRDSVQTMERRYRAYPQYNVHEPYGWKPRQYVYPFP